MEEKAIKEMISAFALGCMDKENFTHFKEYMSEGKELPYAELGELQNIINLIPIILETEEPNPELKKAVAKKLLQFNEEIKAKKQKEKPKTAEDDFTSASLLNKPVDDISTIEKVAGLNLTEQDKTAKTSDSFEGDKTQKFNKANFEKQAPPRIIYPTEQKKSKFPIASIVLFACAFIAIGIIGYYFYSANSSVEKDIVDMQTQVDMLQENYISSQEFVNKYISLIEFFHYNNISVVNLQNSDSSNAGGKLFLSFEESQSLLQVYNMPALSPDEVYEIWYVTNNVSISMGVFTPNENEQYIKLNSFPSVPKDQIDLFRITVEPAAGSETPLGKTIMFGTLVKETPPQPVRRRRY